MFNDSKYTTVYFNIINNAKVKSRIKVHKSSVDYIYFENHHIIPKSLGGGNNRENLVLLTPKEHYICHLLLTKMCRNKFHYQKMIRAWDFLSTLQNKSTRLTSEMYHNLKITMSQIKKEKMINNNPTMKDEVRQKISKANKGRLLGDKNPSKRPEVKEKISAALRGTGKTSNFGIKNGFYGKLHSTETRKLISKKAKLRKNNHPPPPRHGVSNHFSKHYRIITPSGEMLIIHCMREFLRNNNMCGHVIKQYMNKGMIPILQFKRIYRVKNIVQKINCQGYVFERIDDPSGSNPSIE